MVKLMQTFSCIVETGTGQLGFFVFAPGSPIDKAIPDGPRFGENSLQPTSQNTSLPGTEVVSTQ